MLCLEETFLGLPCATGHHEKHLNFLPPYANMKLACLTNLGNFTMIPALFHNGKVCNDPGSVSQWENLQWVLALFHNGKIYNAPPCSVSQWENLQWSQLCFTMGKFAMILALFHNGKFCNGSWLCFTMGKFTMLILALIHNGKIYNAPPGSDSQWENLQ